MPQLDFDSRREVATQGTIAQGRRAGDQTFAAATFGYEFDRGGSLLSAYGRAEGSRTRLSAFSESGGGPLSLAFGQQSFDSLAGAVGIAGEHAMPRPWGVLTARWRGEYTRNLGGATSAALGYADESALPYALRTAAYRERFLGAELGLEAELDSRKRFGIHYGAGSSLDGRSIEQRLDARLDVKF